MQLHKLTVLRIDIMIPAVQGVQGDARVSENGSSQQALGSSVAH